LIHLKEKKIMLQKTLIMASLSLMAVTAFGADPVKQADRQAIDSACSAEASTAQCGADKVGTGLLKCIHAYKQKNSAFTLSAGCKSAIEQLRADKKAGK
jgi:hypothetical protein